MQRLARVVGSFAIVLAAYWVYAHAAVPLIEPSVKGGIVVDEGKELTPGGDYYLKELQALFLPGDWEIDPQKPPMILDINNRAKLLLQKYEPLGDGRMKLSPCTMVFLYDGPAESEEDRLRQSVVLEAPDGAIVKFDAPIDPKRLKIGRPIGGELLGKISIHSEGKSPGPEDNLLIHARDIVWSGQEATSKHPVEFQWGRNVGAGSGMRILFASRDPNVTTDDSGPNISGVEMFEMRKIDRLHIEGNPNKPAAIEANSVSGGPSATDQNPFAAATANPIDITCNGPFRFNMPKRTASFENHVEVRQINPAGPANQLFCDKLSLFFVPRDKDPDAAESSSDLEPARIDALGKPATLSAPNASPKKSAYARGEHLSYDLKTGLIELDGGAEVYLQQGENEIHGISLKYLRNPAGPPNTLGKAWVKGPGWLRGAADDQPNQHLQARWNGELNLSPKDGLQVISLTGGASLDFTGFGKLSADNIFFWFQESAVDGPAKRPLKPVKMLARTNVMLDMSAKSNDSAEPTQISGAVDEMRVWFEQKDAPGGIRVESDGGTVNPHGERGKAEGGKLNPDEGSSPEMPVRGVSYENSRNLPSSGAVLPVSRQQHFAIHGNMLEAKILLQDFQTKPELSSLVISGNVRLEETQTRQPTEKPLVITGDKVAAENLGAMNASPSAANPPPAIHRPTARCPLSSLRPMTARIIKSSCSVSPPWSWGKG